MSKMSDEVHDCLDAHVISVESTDDDYIVTALQIEELVTAHCSARDFVTACVKRKFLGCRNKIAIQTAFEGRYSICAGNQPQPWITEWINMNGRAKLTVECGQTIKAALGEDALSCTEPEWTSNIYWRNIDIYEMKVDMRRYMSHKFNCMKNMMKVQDSAIYMQGACYHLRKWRNLLTMSALYINSGTSPAFLAYLSDRDIATVKVNAKGN